MSERRSRTVLLVLATALSAALITAISCAMASVNRAIRAQLDATVGKAELRIRPAGTGTVLPEGVLETVRGWEGVTAAAGRLQAPLSIRAKKVGLVEGGRGAGGAVREWVRREVEVSTTALGNATVRGFGRESLAPEPRLVMGRMPTADDEVVIDLALVQRLTIEQSMPGKKRDGFLSINAAPVRAAETLARVEVPERTGDAAEAGRINAAQFVGVGETVEVLKQVYFGMDAALGLRGLRRATELRVVGLAEAPPLGGRPQAYLTMGALKRLAQEAGLTQIDVAVGPGVRADEVVRAHAGELAKGLILQTTEKVTSGLNKNLAANQLGMVLATVMAFMSAAFIIMTGLTTNVAERQRELAMVRCVGGTRWQLAMTQVWCGVVVGVLGAAAGVPMGLGVAAGLAWWFGDQVPTGLAVSWMGMGLSVAGSLGAGMVGAAWPAWRVARMSPLAGLASRAEVVGRSGLAAITLAGLVLVLVHVGTVTASEDGQVVFWMYATAGLPALFVGYFLMSVPMGVVVARAFGPVVSRVMGLPRRLLERSVGATPYRHGLTAGALMAGLALMVAIFTNGGAVLRDWIGKIQFPDAFISGLALPEWALEKVRARTDIVADTSAITLQQVETDAFGVRALQQYTTTFVGFDVDAFFRMVRLAWVQGDPEEARRRLVEGGAVIVAREFLVAQGLGVGKRFRCGLNGREHEFEIVGVVASPGLELVSKFFNVGEEFSDQSLHAVFGSREDMKRKFLDGQAAPINMIQVKLTPGALARGDGWALDELREELAGIGFMDAGSGVQIKEQIQGFARGILGVLMAIAMTGMLIACCGVANLVVAGIQARRFEFGVLRAMGASRGVLARLVFGEVVLVGLTACVVGTLMGLQGSWAGQRLHALLMGLTLGLRPPMGPIAAGWGIVMVLALLAAWPAVRGLTRRTTRELLSSMRG
ncbi:MAG: ABC transporter permease [Phycisphaerae bacterium]|nr:ABC transporter permease [Phycisphaerae bacterium]